jgi:hypothetical protein
MLGPITENTEPSVLAPFLGKQGEAMLTLWKAQMDWVQATSIQTTPETNTPEPPPPER